MKILQVIAGLHKMGGTTTFVGGLANALVRQDVEVTIATFRARNPDDEYPLDPRVKVASVAEVAKNPRQFDVVHVHGLWDRDVFWASGWALKHGIPLVWSPHGMLAPWSLKHRWWKKSLPWHLYLKRRLKKAAAIHVTAEGEKKWIEDLGFGPVVIAPLGVEIKLGIRNEELGKREEEFGKRKEERGKRKVVFLARLHKVKAVDRLIQAWDILNLGVENRCRCRMEGEFDLGIEKRSNVHCPPPPSTSTSSQPWELEIAGPDCGVRGELEKYIAEHKVPRVKFVGELNGQAKYDFLSAADLYVLPSFTENFGVTVVEALACGTPVIVSKGTPWQGVEGVEIGVENRCRCRAEFVDLESGDTFDQIEQYLRKQVSKTFENKALGIVASIGSMRNANELAKHMAAGESPEVHKFAAKNVGVLFSSGVVGISHEDKKAAPGQRWVTRFSRIFTPFVFSGTRYLATVTLKNVDAGGRIYAVESVEINQDAKPRSTPRRAISEDLNSAPILDLASQLKGRIAYYVGDVNRTHPVFIGRSEPFSVDRTIELLNEHALNQKDCPVHSTPTPTTYTSSRPRCGWWVDNDPETLAKTLREAMSLSDEERRKMGEVGREWVRRDFSWEGVGAKMKAAYEQLVSGGR